jgi:pyocin large subunit-like protein
METRVWALTPSSIGAVCALALVSLTACDGAPSAIPARSHAATEGFDRRLADAAPEGGEARQEARYSTGSGGGARAEAADTPLFHGKPIWAANKNHSGQENADYHFKRDGDVFGSTSEDDFLTKVHAFIDSPPQGVLTLTRSNGDRLMYDPKGNIFAVADKNGAPRTLFKPKDGQAYWDKQKDAEAKGDDYTSSRRSARKSGSDDNG